MQGWSELIPVGVLAALVLGFFLRAEFVRGSRPLLAAPLWAFAWSALILSGLAFGVAGESLLLRALGRVGDALFPILLLAGAFAFSARPMPRWLWPLAALLIVAETTLGLLFDRDLSMALGSFLEAPILLASAWVVRGGRAGMKPGLAERALPAFLCGVAATELLDIAIAARFGDEGVIFAWMVVALTTSFVQVLVFAERSRAREERLREQRRFLRRAAGPLLEADGSREALTQVVREIAAAGIFPFFGVWLRSADGTRFEAVDGATARAVPHALRSASTDDPLLRAALDARAPIFLGPESEPPIPADVQALGIRWAFVTPLRAGERSVGLFTGSFAAAPDDDDRALVADLADEVAVVIASAQLRQRLAERSAELAAQSSLLQATVDCVPAGIVMTEPGGRIALMNRAIAQQLDLDDPRAWLGRSAFDLFASLGARIEPASRSEIDGWIARYEPQTTPRIESIEVRVAGPEPRILLLATEPVFASDGRHLGRVSVTRDVTNERELSEHMQHAERLQTVGTLAGGLAHDFNNQLTAILGNARLLLDKLAPDDPIAGPLLDLEHSAEHCAELTQGLLAFARQGSASRSAVDLAVAMAEVETLLRPTLPPDVRLDVEIAPGTPPIAADAFQLRRVLVNLVNNGRDAVGARGAVSVWARIAPPEPAHPDASVEIGVRDDGSGMDEATRRRIFDPFFSTKELGRGTGLGLAIVYGIVGAHGGTIEVESAAGRGSTFRVRWPAASGLAKPLVPLATGPSEVAAPATILVAEDEPSVRRLTRAALERAGHRVVEASDGVEAVERHAALGGAIDLVLIDLSMPRCNGLDALEAMRAADPTLCAIVMSGHPDRERARPWPAAVAVLPKPFGPRTLLEHVDRALGAKRSSRPPR